MRPSNLSGSRDAASACAALLLILPASAGEPGKLTEERWTGIAGTSLTALTSNTRYPNSPSIVTKIAGVEPAANAGDSYGRRLRGYLTAPQAGNYTFWIAGDDSCELWLSTSSNPANKQRLAWSSAYTNFRQWTKFTTQKSAMIALIQGQRYYLEVLHKEGTGGDHVSIAWQEPGGVQTVIPASAVDSFESNANDADNDGLPDDWEVANGTSTDSGTGAQGANGANGDPDADGFTNREEWLRQSSPKVYGTIPGGLKREIWQGISGTTVASLTSSPAFLGKPNHSGFMAGASAPQNIADTYGQRLRGYVTIPATGSYRFFVAGDDDCELWLSDSGSPFEKARAAYLNGWTAANQWTKYASQKSAPFVLQQGQVVYVELLHKESIGGDFAALGWSFDEGAPTAIPAAQLAAFATLANDRDDDSLPDDWEAAHGFDLADNGLLHPEQLWSADPDHDTYSNLQEGGFGTDPHTRSGVPGTMTREVWYNLPGSLLADFTGSPRYWQTADSVGSCAGAAAPSNAGDNYAARLRAHITAPVTGDYTFWIASDDDSELRLSTDGSKFKRVKIASLTGYVDPQSWDSESSQKSALIHLTAGQKYFIEALHKESRGADHCAIAWLVPGGSRQLIPASALEPFTGDSNDIDNDDLPDDWESTHGFSLSAGAAADPAQHPLADPDHDGYSNLEEGEYGTDPRLHGGLPGTLLLETWNNLGAAQLGDLAWNSRMMEIPDTSEFIFAAETPVDRADDFAARMRGYIIAPATGNYTFQLAGDDFCQLWLSPSESQFAKQKIASVDRWTNVRQWTKYPAQTSAAIPLVAGQKYYVEAFMKETVAGDHLEIGWKTPGSATTTVIPGSALESYAYDTNDADGDNMPADWEISHGLNPAINDGALDPDQDGVANFLEYSAGTDPQVKSTISGGLLHELWWNVPGQRVRDFTSSPRILQQPDLRNLVTSAQGPVNIGNGYGNRLRGYLTAPVTGTYTFWAAGDEDMEFWLSTSENKFAKELLVSPTIVTHNYDADLSMKSRAVTLVAGQRYFLEILHIDGHSADYCEAAWQIPGGSREIIPGSVLSSYIPTADDSDDDGLPDAWETANGLSPDDNGHINPKNGAQGDLDGDGLSNVAEFKAGTRADLADTDGDGLNDRDELEMMETSALMVDAAPFESVAIIPGASYTAASGAWIQENAKAKQDCVRGWLDYPVTLQAAGVYQLDLAFTPIADTGVSPDYEVVFSADGKSIQRTTVTVAEATSGHAKILSPWLTAGSHTLRVFIDNSYHFRRVSVDQLEVLAARGPDANTNGTPDWIDLRLAKNNSLEAPSESITSPVCLEGKSRWFEMTSINGSPVLAAPNDHWFANIPLSATEPTTITAALENGGVTATRQVNWTPVNLLECGDLTIRQGDSLLFTAFENTSDSNKPFTLTLGGQSHTISGQNPLVQRFDTAGSISVQISGSGGSATAAITIHVVAAPLLESPVCVVGNYREVSIPALPDGVSLQLDNRIEIRGTTTYPAGSKLHVVRLNTLEDRQAVFRLGTAGPIFRALPILSMRVRSGGETVVLFAENLGNNTWNVEMPLIVDGLYAGTSLTTDLLIGGVTFDDGSLSKTLALPGDVTSEGDFTHHFYKVGTGGSNCYRIKIFQGATRIAYFQ